MSGTPTTSTLSQQDATFLQTATGAVATGYQANLSEIGAASNPAVSEFARWGAADASSLGMALDTVASADGVAAQPATATPPAGSDLAFLANAITQDQALVTLFTTEKNSGKDPALVSVATQALPSLQAKLSEAQALQTALTPASTSTTTNKTTGGTASSTTASSSSSSNSAFAVPPSMTPTGANGTASIGPVSAQDTQFMQFAAQSGLGEITEGSLASSKSGNQAVAEFGRWMIADHSAANDALMFLAKGSGVTLPTTLDPEDQQLVNTLQNQSGSTFDSTYISGEVLGHAMTVMQFVKEVQTGSNPAVVGWAQQLLPTLEQHLDESIALENSVNGGGVAGGIAQLGATGSAVAALLSSPAALALVFQQPPPAPPAPGNAVLPTAGGPTVLNLPQAASLLTIAHS